MSFTYWILTIPHYAFMPYLPPGIVYMRGQLEQGGNTNYLHWQLVVHCSRQRRLAWIRNTFGPYHADPTRSAAAESYCFKDETAIPGTRFELGNKPIRRNSRKDWDSILASAKRGQFDAIPSDVLIRSYSSLRRIYADSLEPTPIERQVFVFWGKTGTGKSRRAWMEAGIGAYPKCPNTKFWDGYRNHEHVVIDEFRGSISISHVLRWFDRYPVNVEIKGSSTTLNAKKIWITSNLDPRVWYPNEDQETVNALLRRLQITHFDSLQ